MRYTIFEGKSTAGSSGVVANPNWRAATVYVVFSPGVSSGAVVVETAHDRNFGGTWSLVQNVSAASNTVSSVPLSTPHAAVRVRITTAISGGTVSAYIVGRS